MRVSGYAARYGVLSGVLSSGNLGGEFRERLAPRLFDRVLSTKPDVVMLLNHDANNILGRTSAGTLQLRSDDNGLWFDCELPNTQAGRDTHESIKRRDLRSCSFAFNTNPDTFDWSEEEPDDTRSKTVVRTIRDISVLHDVSVVTYPAYPDTSIDARHNVVAAEVRSQLESFVRSVDPFQQTGESTAEWKRRCRRLGICRSRRITAEMNDLAETRDLNRYPLSGYEQRVLAERRRVFMNDILFS
jgi:HK97 family phage prohead protease